MLRRRLGAVSFAVFASLMTCVLMSTHVLAGLGQPVDGQTGLQIAATDTAGRLADLYHLVNIIIIAIAAFVLILMIVVVVRFNEKKNPEPDRVAHHTLLEVAWTVIPIMILVVIAIPSFKLLYEQYSFPKPYVTIKAVGNAWFWEHEYLDQKVTITSNMVTDEDVLRAKLGDEQFDAKYAALDGVQRTSALHTDSLPVWNERKELRQLTVDQEIAVPVNQVVHLLVTSNDVIHAWAIPSFGARMQAVPGRTAATWFKPNTVGTFHGQCSVLCGKNHSAMPITIRVVEQSVYDAWMAALQAKDRKKATEILKADAASSGAKQSLAAAP